MTETTIETATPSEPSCTHHWLYDGPLVRGKMLGICKKCGCKKWDDAIFKASKDLRFESNRDRSHIEEFADTLVRYY